MSNHQEKLPITNIGITTIITAFIIVCLVTFASLSYVNALNDHKLSLRVAEHNDQYYSAYNLANQKIAEIADHLETSYKDYTNNGLSDISDEYVYEFEVGDNHILCVRIVPNVNQYTVLNELTPLEYLEKHALPLYQITRFEVETTRDWTGDDNILPLQTISD